jgi:D-serine deaminase-like pyridoxal phosphate-dependent protein
MQVGAQYSDLLRTPAFLVNLDRVKNNAQKIANFAQQCGLKLRPHVKTHKTWEIAQLQCRYGATGITVSTLAEAHYFASHGFKDILYAVPLSPDKITESLRLAERITFSVITDHEQVITALIDRCRKSPTPVGVYLKINAGAQRAGVEPEDPRIPYWAEQLHLAPGVDFKGILTHAGQSYLSTHVDVGEVALQEAAILRKVANRIEGHGIPCPERSLGSTPVTSVPPSSRGYDGITEMRPGNYIFYDRYMLACGHCTLDEIACSVLTRVIGVYPHRKHLLIDAGALALSKDHGPLHLRDFEGGYGLILDHPGWKLAGLSQEHGRIEIEDASEANLIKPGDFLEIVPNHSCLTAALFPEYRTTEQGQLVGSLNPVRGW